MSQLGNWFVEFSSKGLDTLKAAMEGVQKGLAALQEQATKIGRAVDGAFGGAIRTVEGFVRAGVNASAMGQQLHFIMDQLYRTIAGLFGPELSRMIDILYQFNQRLLSLTDAQKDQIAAWLKWGFVAVTLATVVPRLVGQLQAMVAVVSLLSKAFLALVASMGPWSILLGIIAAVVAELIHENGIKGLLDIIKPLVDAFSPLAEVLPILSDMFKSLVDAVKPVLPPLIDIAKVLIEVLAIALKTIAEYLAAIIKFWQPVYNFFAELSKLAYGALATALGVVGKALKVIVDALKWIIERGKDAIRILTFGLVDLRSGNLLSAAIQQAPRSAGGRGQVPPRLPGFESLQALYDRLALVSRFIGTGIRTPEQEQLDELRGINRGVAAVEGAVRGLRPATVRG